MRGPVEIELAMVPQRHLDIRRIVLNLTIILMKKGLYVPWTLTLTLNPTNPRHSTLLISYDYLPELISEFLTLSSMSELHPGWGTTDGENTKE